MRAPVESSLRPIACRGLPPLISFCLRSTLSTKNPSMTRIRINYDGWLSLPTAVRRKLGLTTGDQLELELSEDGITLRPVRPGTTADEAAPEPVATAEPSVSATPPAAPMVKRAPGRPRKPPPPVLPPPLKARGGRRKVTATAEPSQ